MSRIRAAAAVTVLGAFLLAGAGAARADDTAGADHQSNSGVVSNTGSGNVVGNVLGNLAGAQQTALGSGAGNQGNTLAAAGNTGSIGVLQGNGELPVPAAPAAPQRGR
ncbi:hypothetical protein ACFVFS_05285 [Kitasatospora sp. NPDC057692]|uniref:hypothetical protein n=1 Tax=Kitasatospora sp. NPDC057692 TaxID=3346215 RepID=UPI0036CB89AD